MPPESRLLIDVFNAGRSARRRTLTEFAEQEINVLTGPRKGRFSVDSQPFVRAMWSAWQSGLWRRRATTGPVQSGKSLTAYIIPILYHLFEVREDVICGLPTLDMAEVKWEKDLKPVIEASRFRDLLPRTGKGSRGGTPTQVIFRNGVSLLFMAGGGGDKQRAGATARVLAITEVDGMGEMGGTSVETDKVRQLENRTRAFGMNALTYMECTVSTDEGRIWQEYQAGTASRLIVPCPHCDAWVTPEREHLIGWEDAPDKIAAGLATKFGCPECGILMGEQERDAMNRQCRLIHRGQELTETGEIVGTPTPTDTFGFRWNAFNNLFLPLEQLGQAAWEASDSGSEEAEREQKQFIWCIPLEIATGDRTELTAGMIRGSAKGYSGRCSGLERGILPDGTDCVTAFVDLGKRALNWVAMGWSNRGVVLDYGAFATSQPDVVGEDVAIADALRALLREIGAAYPSVVGLVDSGKWTDTVYGVLREFPQWQPSKGFGRKTENKQGSYSHPRKHTTDKQPSPDASPWHRSLLDKPRIWIVNFDSDAYKHRVVNALVIPPQRSDKTIADNCIQLPGSEPSEHAEFAKQCLTEKWNADKFEWVRKGDNHYFDCLVGNLVARGVAAATTHARRRVILSELQRQKREMRG